MTRRARYQVEHETRYVHETSVSLSQHVAHLRPRELPHQRVLKDSVRVDPAPARAARRIDYFGNAVDQFTVLGPYSELVVSATSEVEVLETLPPGDPGSSPPWEEARDALVYHKGAAAREPSQYAYASRFVSPDREVRAFAREAFPPGVPLLEGALILMHKIHSGFLFDAQATTLTTPLNRVLAERRGVCQDFAHLQIACLRALGLAARYVSGYILTDPPPGQPRLLGADASHAWLAVYCPRFGWVDLDPTNDVVVSLRHVTLAYGRDYADVSPLRGVILGGAEHELKVAVSVTPIAEGEGPRAAAG